MVLLVFLSQRVAAGRDPVLGPARPAATRPLIVHRILRKVIVETTVPAHSHVASSASTAPEITSQASGPAMAAPVTRSS